MHFIIRIFVHCPLNVLLDFTNRIFKTYNVCPHWVAVATCTRDLLGASQVDTSALSSVNFISKEVAK